MLISVVFLGPVFRNPFSRILKGNNMGDVLMCVCKSNLHFFLIVLLPAALFNDDDFWDYLPSVSGSLSLSKKNPSFILKPLHQLPTHRICTLIIVDCLSGVTMRWQSTW